MNVLQAHWNRNWVPTSPSVNFLHSHTYPPGDARWSLSSSSANSQATTPTSTDSPLPLVLSTSHTKQNSKKSMDGTNPQTAAFYPSCWQEVISIAKLQHRNSIALDNAFPQAISIIRDSKDAMECLTKALAEYWCQGLDVEPSTSLWTIHYQRLIGSPGFDINKMMAAVVCIHYLCFQLLTYFISTCQGCHLSKQSQEIHLHACEVWWQHLWNFNSSL